MASQDWSQNVQHLCTAESYYWRHSIVGLTNTITKPHSTDFFWTIFIGNFSWKYFLQSYMLIFSVVMIPSSTNGALDKTYTCTVLQISSYWFHLDLDSFVHVGTLLHIIKHVLYSLEYTIGGTSYSSPILYRFCTNSEMRRQCTMPLSIEIGEFKSFLLQNPVTLLIRIQKRSNLFKMMQIHKIFIPNIFLPN